jgi:hypothetical protein
VEALMVKVRVEEFPVVELGAKVPLAPAGRPLTEKLTAELKPPVRLIVTE